MVAERGAPAEDAAIYIRCQDLFKIYKSDELEVVALRGLDLEVRRGEMMAIVGASGSGKSTLLNILAGLDQPSAGGVTVGARRPADDAGRAARRLPPDRGRLRVAADRAQLESRT